YWSMLAPSTHPTVSACYTCVGGLMASRTTSGPTSDPRGSLLELGWNGQTPLSLPGGSTRSFLEDGDELTITGWWQGEGYRVGFGEVRGELLPALTSRDPEQPVDAAHGCSESS